MQEQKAKTKDGKKIASPIAVIGFSPLEQLLFLLAGSLLQVEAYYTVHIPVRRRIEHLLIEVARQCACRFSLSANKKTQVQGFNFLFVQGTVFISSW